MKRCLFALSAAAASFGAAPAAVAGDGEDLYGFNCASCHEPPAREAVGAADLWARLPDYGAFVETVRSGGEIMPSFSAAIISDAELEEIYLYLSGGAG